MIKNKIAENATLKWPESRKIAGKVEIVGVAGGLRGGGEAAVENCGRGRWLGLGT